MTDNNMPNDSAVSAATVAPVVPSLESIEAKMNAMVSQTQRNQIRATNETTTGSKEEAEVQDPVDHSSDAVPEVAEANDYYTEDGTEESHAPESQVSQDDADSSAEDIIDFIEFAETNPTAKFKFVRNGKEIMVDAKKAAAILGQGGAIHEDARQLKIERAEFDEYTKELRNRQEGLTLAMEFTVQPQLESAYAEILKTQNYQTTFQQQLAQTTDPAQQARITASMRQNELYIQQQSQVINRLKPAVDQFRQVRSQQVAERLDANRKAFKDAELKNEYVFKELREKVAKVWPEAKGQIVPGIENIDLISSDEALLSLVRDGLKFRDRPKSQSAGSSIAALTNRRGQSVNNRGQDDNISKLREQAKQGGRAGQAAADNLLVQRMNMIRSTRSGR